MAEPTDFVTLTRNMALEALRSSTQIADAATRQEVTMHLVTVVQVIERLRGTQDGRPT